MATFLKGNRVEAAKTETVVDIDIDTGRNDRDVEMGDNTVADKRGSGTEQVGHHFQADLGLDLKVSEEKEQEQPAGKKKKTKWKTKSRQVTFEEQAEPDKSSQAQGQAINGNDTEQTGRTDIQYVAQVAQNCTYIPKTGIVMYNSEANYNSDWAFLVSGREMNFENNRRFEIEVVNTGHKGFIVVGLVPADYNTDAAPGWLKDSVAYHTDDGGQRRHYCYDGFNWLDLSSNLLILIVIPLRWTYNNAQWGVFGVGYICWTLRVIKFITMSRKLGQLGFIIQGLFADVLKFGVYFLIILLSFSGGLFLALKGDDNLNVHDKTSTIWGILFVGVRVLFEGQPIGDLEYTGANGYRTLSCIVMLLFLGLTCAVMLNIFIAQLSSRFGKEDDKVDEKFETHKARTIAKYDLGEDLTSFLFCCRREPMWVRHFKCKIKIRRSDDFSEVLKRKLGEENYFPFMMQPCIQMCYNFVGYVLCLPCMLICIINNRPGSDEGACDIIKEIYGCSCEESDGED